MSNMRNVYNPAGPSLDEDMRKDIQIISLCKDRGIAVQFYGAMCNVSWRKLKDMPPIDLTSEVLKGTEHHWYLCSWRNAGHIIADMRNNAYGLAENYMDFYCAGNEANVTDLVRENFKRLGWTPNESDIVK